MPTPGALTVERSDGPQTVIAGPFHVAEGQSVALGPNLATTPIVDGEFGRVRTVLSVAGRDGPEILYDDTYVDGTGAWFTPAESLASVLDALIEGRLLEGEAAAHFGIDPARLSEALRRLGQLGAIEAGFTDNGAHRRWLSRHDEPTYLKLLGDAGIDARLSLDAFLDAQRADEL